MNLYDGHPHWKQHFDPLRLKLIMLEKHEANPSGKNPDYFYVKGLSYLTVKDHQNAQKCFEKGVKDKVTHLLCRFNLGVVYFMTGQFQAAANEYAILYGQCIELGIHPMQKHPLILFNKAVCELQCGFLQACVESAGECIRQMKEKEKAAGGNVLGLGRRNRDLIISILQVQGVAYFRLGDLKNSGICYEQSVQRIAIIESEQHQHLNLKDKDNESALLLDVGQVVGTIPDQSVIDQSATIKEHSRPAAQSQLSSTRSPEKRPSQPSYQSDLSSRSNAPSLRSSLSKKFKRTTPVPKRSKKRQTLVKDTKHVEVKEARIRSHGNVKEENEASLKNIRDFIDDFKNRLKLSEIAAVNGKDEIKAFREGERAASQDRLSLGHSLPGLALEKQGSKRRPYDAATHRSKTLNALEMEVEKDIIQLKNALVRKKEMKECNTGSGISRADEKKLLQIFGQFANIEFYPPDMVSTLCSILDRLPNLK